MQLPAATFDSQDNDDNEMSRQLQQIHTILLRCESMADFQAHVVESTEVFSQRVVQFAFQSCQNSKLVPDEHTSFTVTLDTKCRNNAIKISFLTTCPMPAKQNDKKTLGDNPNHRQFNEDKVIILSRQNVGVGI